jgi:hypothetical protein
MITGAKGSSVPAPQFRIVDWGSTRSDLATRKEIKFALSHADVDKLRNLFEVNCHRRIYNESVSTVRSIYFDDALLSACQDNLDGMGLRRKVRLRWYDDLQPGTTFFFEIKWRRGRVTGKHRLQLESEEPLGQLTYKQIVAGLEKVIPAEFLGDVFVYCEPTVLVQYQREHFASDDGALRVTLDYDITYYDQTGKASISTSFPRRLESIVVIEGKTPIGREAELPELFYPFRARATRCSKYVQGCRLLGLIQDLVSI